MKKILLITVFLFSIPTIINAQNIQLKEYYDKTYPDFASTNFDYGNCYLRGNSLSWTLSGLLRLYQTTGDKAYLVKFINHCIKLQKVRKDEVNSSEPAVWVRTTDYFCNVQNEIV